MRALPWPWPWPWPWPVWPSTVSEIRREFVWSLLRPYAHSYGVAGSPVVPITMTGFAVVLGTIVTSLNWLKNLLVAPP